MNPIARALHALFPPQPSDDPTTWTVESMDKAAAFQAAVDGLDVDELGVGEEVGCDGPE